MRTTESIMSATHASTLPVRNPRTGAIDDTLHVTPRAEIVSAAAELRRAQRDWQALGIEGRTRLKLEVVGDVAQLSRAATGAGPVKRRGQRLVFAGSLPDDWDSASAVNRMRTQRLKQ